MLALAFATVSHAGALAPLPGRTWETVSHSGRPGRPCLRLSRTLGALGGHVCDCLALCASRGARAGQSKFPKNIRSKFHLPPYIKPLTKSKFSRPRSLLVMLALAFATVSHAGAFAPLPGRSWETVSHSGRPGRPCLRLSHTLRASGRPSRTTEISKKTPEQIPFAFLY